MKWSVCNLLWSMGWRLENFHLQNCGMWQCVVYEKVVVFFFLCILVGCRDRQLLMFSFKLIFIMSDRKFMVNAVTGFKMECSCLNRHIHKISHPVGVDELCLGVWRRIMFLLLLLNRRIHKIFYLVVVGKLSQCLKTNEWFCCCYCCVLMLAVFLFYFQCAMCWCLGKEGAGMQRRPIPALCVSWCSAPTIGRTCM